MSDCMHKSGVEGVRCQNVPTIEEKQKVFLKIQTSEVQSL